MNTDVQSAGDLHRGVPGRRWLPAEQHVVDRYLKGIASGEFATLDEALEPCIRTLARWRSKQPRTSRPPVRTRSSVYTRLSVGALAVRGRLCRLRPKWTLAERKVIGRYVRASLKAGSRGTYQVAQDCLAELRRRYRKEPKDSRPGRFPVLRTFGGLYSQLCRDSRFAGRVAALRGDSWTDDENESLDRHAAEIFHGRVSTLRDAARSCLSELERIRIEAGLTHRRTLQGVESKLRFSLEALGQPSFGRYRVWSDHEAAIIKRFAQKAADGHPGGARALVGPCCEEVNRSNAARLGLRGSVPPRYYRSQAGIYRAICHEAIRLGRVVSRRWKPREAALAEQCVRRNYGGRTSFPPGQLTEAGRRIHDVLVRNGYARTTDACIAWLGHRRNGELPWRLQTAKCPSGRERR